MDWFSVPMSEVVDYEPWQKLRTELKGTWKVSKKRNIKLLKDFLGDFSDTRSLLIVYNYLRGTAFRIGLIDSVEIRKLRKEISIALKNKKGFE